MCRCSASGAAASSSLKWNVSSFASFADRPRPGQASGQGGRGRARSRCTARTALELPVDPGIEVPLSELRLISTDLLPSIFTAVKKARRATRSP